MSGVVLTRTRLGRISEKYSYHYNILKRPVTFDFGVHINCSSDEEVTVISSDEDAFEEIEPSQTLDETMRSCVNVIIYLTVDIIH